MGHMSGTRPESMRKKSSFLACCRSVPQLASSSKSRTLTAAFFVPAAKWAVTKRKLVERTSKQIPIPACDASQRVRGRGREREGHGEERSEESEGRGSETEAHLVGDDSSEPCDDVGMVNIADVGEQVAADEAHQVCRPQTVLPDQLVSLPHMTPHRRFPSRSLARCRQPRPTF
eukprot:763661-Hanusia_phi.AAC.3